MFLSRDPLISSDFTASVTSGFSLAVVSVHGYTVRHSHGRPCTHPGRLGLASAHTNKHTAEARAPSHECARAPVHTHTHTHQKQFSPGDTPQESCSYCQHTDWELRHHGAEIVVTSSLVLLKNHCSRSGHMTRRDVCEISRQLTSLCCWALLRLWPVYAACSCVSSGHTCDWTLWLSNTHTKK